MKLFAMTLVFGAFLAGAFISVLDPRLVNWTYLVPILIVGVIGLWLNRKAERAASHSSDRLTGNITVLQESLDNILGNLENLHARREDLPVHEARFEIDRLFRDDLNNFAEARESMVHVFGIQNYADVMSNFAAGERYINRVWSASTDGYVDEVMLYLGRARDQFREASRHFAEQREKHSDPGAGIEQS